IGLAAAAAGIAIWAAPFLPPVPVHEVEAEAARAIEDREPSGAAHVFEANVERVYVWFAVAAPKKSSQAVRLRWWHDQKPLEKELATSIIGGRKAGFRTWGYVSSPKPGHWRADLVADSGQLIARARFEVLEPLEPSRSSTATRASPTPSASPSEATGA